MKEYHFPNVIFFATFGCLLTMAGIHAFLVYLLGLFNANGVISASVIILYWIGVSAIFTLFTRSQIIRNYEKPMKQLAEAAGAVAGGDFSVYIPTIHAADQTDYLDVMIHDFNSMVEELGSIETLKTDFFSNVSHEIKTPLSAILNYAECLKEENLTEDERKEYIETIIQSSKRLSKLITNILKLNKLENQRIQPVREPIDICAQLCECAVQYEDMWEEKEIDFEVDIEERLMITGDESLMALVWGNLISNAIKFTEKNGKIILRQTSNGDEVIVSISDTGCGMSNDTIRHMFDKFYQGDTSRSQEGNGLGLAMVIRAVDLIDGTIEVTSEENAGTTITVTIPM